MNLSVKQTEHGLVVLIQRLKGRGQFSYCSEMEWVPAGQDELNEVCRRLSIQPKIRFCEVPAHD